MAIFDGTLNKSDTPENELPFQRLWAQEAETHRNTPANQPSSHLQNMVNKYKNACEMLWWLTLGVGVIFTVLLVWQQMSMIAFGAVMMLLACGAGFVRYSLGKQHTEQYESALEEYMRGKFDIHIRPKADQLIQQLPQKTQIRIERYEKDDRPIHLIALKHGQELVEFDFYADDTKLSYPSNGWIRVDTRLRTNSKLSFQNCHQMVWAELYRRCTPSDVKGWYLVPTEAEQLQAA